MHRCSLQVSTGCVDVVSTGCIDVVSTGCIDVVSKGCIVVVSTGCIDVVSKGCMDVVSTGCIDIVSKGCMDVVSTGCIDVVSKGCMDVRSASAGRARTGQYKTFRGVRVVARRCVCHTHVLQSLWLACAQFLYFVGLPLLMLAAAPPAQKSAKSCMCCFCKLLRSGCLWPLVRQQQDEQKTAASLPAS
jgi:hypothetical protein